MMANSGMKGALLIISGPSGSGKGTIANELVMDEQFVLSVSVTSREPRYSEEDGTHYFFKTREQFEALIRENKLLEWAEFVGNYYGTPKDYVIQQLENGKNVILEIDVQGALQVKKIFPQSVLIFIVPPNAGELKKRLDTRGTEDAKSIEMRIERAKDELLLIDRYDYIVVNDSIFKAVRDIINIARAEQLRAFRNIDIIERIKGEINRC